MYYILYEGLKIESNEPVYCTVYNLFKVIFIYLYMLRTTTYVCLVVGYKHMATE